MGVVLMKYKSKKRSTPHMGGTRNKMYTFKPGEQPNRSIPAMGKAGGKGITFAPFAAIGSVGQKQADQMQANVKAAYDRQEKPGMHRVGKGKYKFDNPEDEKRRTEELSNLQKSIFSVGSSIPAMGRGKISIPAMGPLGAAGGAYVGKNVGSWIGSAGKLIGKKHEKYGRKAGEYIGGSVGGVFGGLLSPI